MLYEHVMFYPRALCFIRMHCVLFECIMVYLGTLCFICVRFVFAAAPPSFDKDIRDQAVDQGELLKLKIPFSGTGPFDFKLYKGNREIPSNNHIKFTTFDDYVVLQIRGELSRDQ